jgi:hypothetical protein
MQNRNLLTPPHKCVYKIEKFRTLSAPSEIDSQFPPPLRTNIMNFGNKEIFRNKNVRENSGKGISVKDIERKMFRKIFREKKSGKKNSGKNLGKNHHSDRITCFASGQRII